MLKSVQQDLLMTQQVVLHAGIALLDFIVQLQLQCLYLALMEHLIKN